jgi:hypothetical protein
VGALKQQSVVMVEAAMLPLAEMRTREPFGPAPTLERRGTILLATVPVLKFHQIHATLKLDSVHRHDHLVDDNYLGRSTTTNLAG